VSRGVWVWVGLSWTAQVQQVLAQYGDRVSDVSVFGWQVDATGALMQTFDPSLLDQYRATLAAQLGQIFDHLAIMSYDMTERLRARPRLASGRPRPDGRTAPIKASPPESAVESDRHTADHRAVLDSDRLAQ